MPFFIPFGMARPGLDPTGFRSGYSVVDNIFSLSACIEKHLWWSLLIPVGRLDFQKTFDKIHQKLFISLLQ